MVVWREKKKSMADARDAKEAAKMVAYPDVVSAVTLKQTVAFNAAFNGPIRVLPPFLKGPCRERYARVPDDEAGREL